MGIADELIENNRVYARERFDGDLPLPPRRRLAVVACMDSRLPVFQVLGLKSGDAHVIRNAGGVVTDDVIRSLTISQRKLGNREIVLVHHTDCGMLTFTDDQLRNELLEHTGQKPSWSPESFTDIDVDIRSSMERIRATPFLVDGTQVRGFVYDVHTGLLREVAAEPRTNDSRAGDGRTD